MRRVSSVLFAGTTLLVVAFFDISVNAAPKGWKCSYSVTPIVGPLFYDAGPYYYACYGRSLRATRARARADCRRRSSCETGACIPLSFFPGRYCERD